MTKYLLETTTCSRIMENDLNVTGHLDALAESDYPFTCTVVKGEILFGIERLPTGRRRQDLEHKASRLFSSLPCEAIPEAAATHYAQIKRAAQRQGTPLDENDLWIAATARALEAILVTSDSDYQRITGVGLRLEDWTSRQQSSHHKC